MEPDSSLDLIIDDLPGIGRRYEMTGDQRRPHHRPHHSQRAPRRPRLDPGTDQASAVELTDRQARKLGAILGGAFFKPAVVEELEAVFGNLLEPATASSSSAATRTAARSTSWWSTEPYTLPGCGAG
jgi:K+/H+ antiporter YhaU regulatory subunit KhtT